MHAKDAHHRSPGIYASEGGPIAMSELRMARHPSLVKVD